MPSNDKASYRYFSSYKQSFFITEPLPLPKPSSVRYQPPTPHWQIAKEKTVKPPSEIRKHMIASVFNNIFFKM
jgi:hypothetical protein